MKHTLKILTLLVSVLISNNLLAQPNSEMYMKGKWTASCPTEILDHASINKCQLCPFVIDHDDKSKGAIKDIELNFLADSIVLNQNGTITTVPYKRNTDNHSISFTLNNKLYNFRMFLYNKERILEDSDGMILVLKEAK